MGENEAPVVSHGRGGQGNIGADPTPYVDGEIVREGPVGDQGDGAYSAGRGGVGNIGSPHIPPAKTAHDTDVIPEIAIRKSTDTDYHTGRGGQGNVHIEDEHKKAKEKEKEKKEKKEKRRSIAHEGLADFLKNKILGRK
ncbi:hypothetical protein VTN00DRAFT_7063 [Thermoascus crustaceus]|uniref:uncharacterized protein n=1 Tax=Thermoascus crustaceus TaxID=5088 RepID=UPI00374302C4